MTEVYPAPLVWESVTAGNVQTVAWDAAANVFVAGSYTSAFAGQLYESADGDTYSNVAAISVGARCSAYSPEFQSVVFVGDNSGGQFNIVVVNKIGGSWAANTLVETGPPLGAAGDLWKSVAVKSPFVGLSTRCVAAGAAGLLIFSLTNLASPRAAGGGITNSLAANGVCYAAGLGMFCAVRTSVDGTNAVSTSTDDGSTWTDRNAVAGDWQAVCWSPELALFCAVGAPASPGAVSPIMTSPDGVTWTARTAPGSLVLFSVTWAPGPGVFVAVASGAARSVIYSANGITWRGTSSPWDTIASVTRGQIAWASTELGFVAAGRDGAGAGRAMRSIDVTGEGEPVYLFEIENFNRDTQAAETIRVATAGYNDQTAPGYYPGRVLRPPTFARYFLAPGTTSGSARAVPGDLVLANDDGALDYLRDRGLAGRAISMLLGYGNLPYSTFIPLAVAKVEQALFDLTVDVEGGKDQVTLRLRDRAIDFTKPLQNTKFLGNNLLPDGLEGGDDLKDKPVPSGWGSSPNITPICVNTSRLIYFVPGDPVAIYDKGAALTRGTDYASQSAMETTAPSAGAYRVWPASNGWYFRLGATPDGVLTADLTEGDTAADRTAAQISYRILTDRAGLTAAEIDAGDMARLDRANSAEVEFYTDGEATIQQAVEAVLGSIGAAPGIDRLNRVRLRRLELPLLENATVTFRDPENSPMQFGDLRIEKIGFVPSNDPDNGVPIWRLVLDYLHNYTVQTEEGLATGVLSDRDRVAFLKAATRSAISSAGWLQVSDPLSAQKTLDTHLIDRSAAQEEADRQLGLYAGRRDFVLITTPLTRAAVEAMDIADVARVVLPRYGYDDGRPLAILGMEYNTAQSRLQVLCWGGLDDVLEDLGAGSGVVDLGCVADALSGWASLGSIASPGVVDRVIDLGSIA